MTKLILYSKENHPLCEKLKIALGNAGITYREVDIRKPEAISELEMNGCFAFDPPVLRVIQDKQSQWFFRSRDLFRNGRLMQESMLDVLRVSRPRTAWPY